MPTNVTEQALWSVLNGMGWWYWAPVCLLAGWCLWGLYGLAPPASRFGYWIRASLYLGFMLVFGSLVSQNTALLSIGLPFIFLGMRGLIKQLHDQCVRQGKIPRETSGQPLGVRLASTIVQSPR